MAARAGLEPALCNVRSVADYPFADRAVNYGWRRQVRTADLSVIDRVLCPLSYPPTTILVGAEGVEPPHDGCKPSVLPLN